MTNEINHVTCPTCGAPVCLRITPNYELHRNEIELRYTAPTAPKPTLCGYQMEQLLVVAELLQRHGVTPEDLHDLKDNFQRAFDILQEEQERIRQATMEQMLRNFQPDSTFPDVKLKKEAET